MVLGNLIDLLDAALLNDEEAIWKRLLNLKEILLMELVIILLALSLLMFVAYRGFSVILFAPICALFAVLLTNPDWVLPFFSNIFMEKMVGFIKAYFPVFILGAIFGKVVEMSGIAESIAKTIIRMIGAKRAILAIVLLGAILTYSGVTLFVVVFAVYPFAANLFREANIPKRLIPGTIALGAFTFTMDALPLRFKTSFRRRSSKQISMLRRSWVQSVACSS